MLLCLRHLLYYVIFIQLSKRKPQLCFLLKNFSIVIITSVFLERALMLTMGLLLFRTNTNLPQQREIETEEPTPSLYESDSESRRPITTPPATSRSSCSRISPVPTPTLSESSTSTSICTRKSERKKRKLDDVDKALLDIDQQIKQCQDLDDDEAGLYGKSIAAKLRSFSPYQFALARRNIENILFDIQYTGNTNETQLQQPTSYTNQQPTSYTNQPDPAASHDQYTSTFLTDSDRVYHSM